MCRLYKYLLTEKMHLSTSRKAFSLLSYKLLRRILLSDSCNVAFGAQHFFGIPLRPSGKKCILMNAFFGLIVIIFLSQNAHAQTPGIIEASTDKHEVATGEIFTYTLKIEGEFLSPKLTIPKLVDFTIVSQNQQRQYTSKGIGTALMIKITYNLFASNPGNFTIEGASVTNKGKKLEAQPIAIEVTGEPLKEKIKVAPRIKKGIDL